MENEGGYELDLDIIHTEDVKFGLRLFDIFSNIDTLKIFLYAENGIENSKDAMRELKLTPKRYYSRLKELVDAGILKKEGGIYKYTAFGRALNKFGSYLLCLVKNRDRLEILSDILSRDSLDQSKISKFVEIIFENLDETKLFTSLFLNFRDSTKMEKILTYDKLVDKLVQSIDSAERSILLASRYLDTRVSERIVNAIKKGLDVKIIMSKENLFDKLLKFKLILTPRLLKDIIDLISSFDMDKYVREADIPYSFCIIDDGKCFFEFPKIKGDEFSIAFYLSDRRVAEKFKELFYDIWKRSKSMLSLEIFKGG